MSGTIHFSSTSQEPRFTPRNLPEAGGPDDGAFLAVRKLEAFSANAAEPVQHKRGLLTHKPHHVQRQTRQQQTEPAEPEKPAVTRLPVPPDTFRA